MKPLPVVKHLDVFANSALRFRPCREVPMVNQLRLQGKRAAVAHGGGVRARGKMRRS
jgi:hypothetical protein